MAHPGSWGGLPDFGITEKIGDALGLPRTEQGGSSVLGVTDKERVLAQSIASGGQSTQPNQSFATQTPNYVPQQQAPTSSGSGGGGSNNNTSVPLEDQARNMGFGSVDELQAWQQLREDTKNAITSGYDSYTRDLDAMIGDLPKQQQTQEARVQNLYEGGIADLTSQKTQGMADLSTQRRKTQEGQVGSLRDIGENISNLFRAGGVLLGARGAGDSSAVGQYGYAVGKLGAKERGKVVAQTRSIENDIADRESRLDNIFMQESNKLLVEKNDKVHQIAQWYQEQINQLRNRKGEIAMEKGKSLGSYSMNLLNIAQQRLERVDEDARNQQNMLTQWATNQSNSIGELKANLQQVGSYLAPQIQSQSFGGMPVDAGGNQSSFYPGSNLSADDLKDNQMFGGMS